MSRKMRKEIIEILNGERSDDFEELNIPCEIFSLLYDSGFRSIKQLVDAYKSTIPFIHRYGAEAYQALTEDFYGKQESGLWVPSKYNLKMKNTIMLGAIIGGIIGTNFKGSDIKTKNFELPLDNLYYTGSTALTIAVMDWACHVNNPYSKEEALSFIRKWASNFSGYNEYEGPFEDWRYRINPKLNNSCDHGCAKRISSLGWFANDENELKKLNNIITGTTHNHPESLKGAEVTAMMIMKARHGATKNELREYAISKYPEIKNLNYEELIASNDNGEGTCQVTMPKAIFCFLVSKSFEDCLKTTLSIGESGGKIAAISCAIAEAFYKEIPEKIVKAVKEALPKEMLKIIEDAEWLYYMK